MTVKYRTKGVQRSRGDYTIRVIAEDSEKALVQWSFAIQLSPGSEVSK